MIDSFDYKEPSCKLCDGKSFYYPDKDAPIGHIPVSRIIEKLDACYNKNDYVEAGRLLFYWQKEAQNLLDKRGELSTHIISDRKYDDMIDFVKREISSGRQVYFVCPKIEDDVEGEVMSVTELYESLSQRLYGVKLGLLHGKMKPKEKDDIMQKFKNGEIDLLVSTTVIEVGVDVPNANIMVIENAERFGLSQLHQLRGRVGRGSEKSYCILICDSDNEATKERMNIMTKTNDGFVISKKDLELRGCGQFFGTRQHGLPELKVANLFTDLEILKNAQKLCQKIIREDPDLEKNKMLKERIKSIFKKLENPDILN